MTPPPPEDLAAPGGTRDRPGRQGLDLDPARALPRLRVHGRRRRRRRHRRAGHRVHRPVARACSLRPDAGRRPTPSTWSPLEYACHVRDVCRLFEQRLELMLTQDAPTFDNWDQDETAVADRYGEQDPATVAGELTACRRLVRAGVRAGAGRRMGAHRHPLERVGVHRAHPRAVRPARPAPPPLGRRGRLLVKPELVYLLLGGSLLLAAVLPQLLHRWALSAPIVLVATGMAIGLLPPLADVELDPVARAAGHRARHRDHRARGPDGRRAGARPPAAVAQPGVVAARGRRPGGCSASRCR